MPTPARIALAALLTAGPALAQPAATLNEPCEAKDPTTAEINSREGVRLAKEGRFGEAVALFRIATRLDPCAPEHPLLLARALARQLGLPYVDPLQARVDHSLLRRLPQPMISSSAVSPKPAARNSASGS